MPSRAVVSTAALARRRLARAHDDTRTVVSVVDKTPGCGFLCTTMKRHDPRGWARDRVFHMSEHGVLFFYVCVRDRRSVILGVGHVPVSNASDGRARHRSVVLVASRAMAMMID